MTRITSPDPLPTITTGLPYRYELTADGVAPYTWSLASGALPEGISLYPGGVLSGVARNASTRTILLAVTDASTPPQSDKDYRDLIVEAGGAGAGLAIATTALPAATSGSVYKASLTADGGQRPYRWSGSALPPGMSLTVDGALGGTCASTGTFRPSFTVTDAHGVKASTSLPLTVTAAVRPSISAAYATGYTWLYDDRGSGAELDVTAFLPTPAPGYSWLGHSLMQGYAEYFGGAPAMTVKALDSSATAPPIGFKEIWDDHGSGGTFSYTFWQLIAPPGYRALGYIFRLRRPPGDYNPPSPQETEGLVCVREDLIADSVYDGLIWINTGCEADNSCSIFAAVNAGSGGYQSGGSVPVFYPGQNTASKTPPTGTPPIAVLARSERVVFNPNPG